MFKDWVNDARNDNTCRQTGCGESKWTKTEKLKFWQTWRWGYCRGLLKNSFFQFFSLGRKTEKLKNWNSDRHGGGVTAEISSKNSVFQFFGFQCFFNVCKLSYTYFNWCRIFSSNSINNQTWYRSTYQGEIYIYTHWPEKYPKNGGLLGGGGTIIYIYNICSRVVLRVKKDMWRRMGTWWLWKAELAH